MELATAWRSNNGCLSSPEQESHPACVAPTITTTCSPKGGKGKILWNVVVIFLVFVVSLVGLVGLCSDVVELQVWIARVQDPHAAVIELQLETAVGRSVVAVAFVDALKTRHCFHVVGVAKNSVMPGEVRGRSFGCFADFFSNTDLSVEGKLANCLRPCLAAICFYGGGILVVGGNI